MFGEIAKGKRPYISSPQISYDFTVELLNYNYTVELLNYDFAVEPLNSGNVGDKHFSEVVLSLAGINVWTVVDRQEANSFSIVEKLSTLQSVRYSGF